MLLDPLVQLLIDQILLCQLHIELDGKKTPVEGGLICPYGIQLNTIIPDFRDHVDLIYFGHPMKEEHLKMSEREASDIGWFSLGEVVNLNTFPSVTQWCNFFDTKVINN